jgi:hypothetical protein
VGKPILKIARLGDHFEAGPLGERATSNVLLSAPSDPFLDLLDIFSDAAELDNALVIGYPSLRFLDDDVPLLRFFMTTPPLVIDFFASVKFADFVNLCDPEPINLSRRLRRRSSKGFQKGMFRDQTRLSKRCSKGFQKESHDPPFRSWSQL